jgi:AbrB family looped-hinge helix DNA binding protein
MTKAIISSKGQIIIPKAVRERLNLNAGTEVMIDVQGEALIIKRMVREVSRLAHHARHGQGRGEPQRGLNEGTRRRVGPR